MCTQSNGEARRRATSSTRKLKSMAKKKLADHVTLRVGIHTVCAWSARERITANCPHCERLSLRVLRSRKALFKEGAFTSVPRGSGPASTEVERQLHSWGSQLDWLEGMETGARSLGSEARSAVSSPRGMGLTLRISSSEEIEEIEEIESADEVPHSPQSGELLEVVTRAVAKLNIDWPAEKQTEPQRSKLDERFLRTRSAPSHRSLPFHTEVSRSWGRPFSARLFIPASDYYGNVAGMTESGYKAMPWVEQMLACYLSPDTASSLKAPTLPSKQLRTTSALVGKGYTAYQADLLKELDEGEEIKKDDITELRRRTGSSFWMPRLRLLACSATP
ncbi:hypothetical protein M9458_004568, partial [Cirrhinus mrigala]